MASTADQSLDHKAPPAFMVYARDLYTSTSDMTAAELGAHIRGLCVSWERGGALPCDDNKRRRIMLCDEGEWPVIWGALAGRLWVQVSDGWVNPQLESYRAERALYRAQQAEKGRRSGHARRNKSIESETNHGSTVVQNRLPQPQANDNVQRTKREPDTQPETNNGSTVVHDRFISPSNEPDTNHGSTAVEFRLGFLATEREPDTQPETNTTTATEDQKQDQEQSLRDNVSFGDSTENDNHRALVKLAHCVMDEQESGGFDAADLEDVFERRAAKARIAYGGDRTRKALESAGLQRANRRRARTRKSA